MTGKMYITLLYKFNHGVHCTIQHSVEKTVYKIFILSVATTVSDIIFSLLSIHWIIISEGFMWSGRTC